jgi:hypothetical protein
MPDARDAPEPEVAGPGAPGPAAGLGAHDHGTIGGPGRGEADRPRWTDDRVRIGILVMAGLAVVVGVIAFLALTRTEVPTRSELVDALRTSGMSAEESTCAADAILDNLHGDDLDAIIERGPGGLPDDAAKTNEPLDEVRAALSECRVAADPVPTTTSTTVPISGTTPATVPGIGDDELVPSGGSEGSTTVPGSAGTSTSTSTTPVATSAP